MAANRSVRSDDAAAIIDAFCDQLWLRDGLAPASIASYRRDLIAWSAWLDAHDSALRRARSLEVEHRLADQFAARSKATSVARRLSAL